MTNILSSSNKIFYFILFIFLSALSVTVALIAKTAPLLWSHAVYFCQKALTEGVITVPHSLPFVITISLLFVLLIGTVVTVFHLLQTYFFVGKLLTQKVKIPLKIKILAQNLGISDKVDVINNSMFSSFCYGLINPRICLSLQLVKTLTNKELEAVLIHEKYHLTNKDPFKVLFTHIASSMFFFIPTISDLRFRYTLSKETLADLQATQVIGKKILASALQKTIMNSSPQLSTVAMFNKNNLFEERIKILSGKNAYKVKLSLSKITISVFVFVLTYLSLTMPVFALEIGTGESHVYYVCPYGGECMMSCKKEGVVQDRLFSQETNFTPVSSSSLK